MAADGFAIGGDLRVGRLGFGAMHLPTAAGSARDGAIAVVRRAVELGVTLIDTAYLYGGGANEELLAEALHPYPPGLLITTKVGVARSAATGEWRLDGRPEVLREQVERGLVRLRTERHALLQLHRVDPGVPLAWLLARSPVILPIPGTSRIAHLEENVAARHLRLTPEQRARLDAPAT
ncbi:aldo/keto reductase [Streptomyces harbinensis]|uniref:Aldo/keto reductase family protein n=2 Tax=Streptomyces harbinensis TaxID=1176198 RepID=A0A1I6SPU8_9ACTN|nr:aldo/keto reductase [Streptomyces harbinensis]SFS78909.1 Aldo/keto reductase family protein [Streptomyces harbinensis]